MNPELKSFVSSGGLLVVDVVVRLGNTTVCTVCDKPEILLKLTPASRNGRIGPCMKRFFNSSGNSQASLDVFTVEIASRRLALVL